MRNFSWHTPEYAHKEKAPEWYWTVGIITAAFVVTAVILGNFLFAIVLAIGAFTLTLFAVSEPKKISVDVSEKGVVIDKVLYPYHSLDAFGLDESRPNDVKLMLKSKKLIMPLVAVPVAHEDIDGLRELLSSHLPEEAFERGLIQTLLERSGF